MQTNPKRSSGHVYDYVIVGGGLSGLLVAKALSHETENILLLDAAEQPGGLNHPVSYQGQQTSNGWRFIPETELSRKALEFVSSLIGEDVAGEVHECQPQTFEQGSLHPFVGFGATPPAFYEELAYFLSPQQRLLRIGVEEWSTRLFAASKGDFWPRSIVTKYFNKSTDNERRVDTLMINGQKTVQAANVIHCSTIRDLPRLLPETALGMKAKQRIGKTQFWTAIGLDLVHSQTVSESSQTHLLNGTTEDEVGPCVGQFLSPQATHQISQWISFVDSDAAEESENIALTLKKMKRQIKRAYPEALEKVSFERIMVAPDVGGHGELKLTARQTLPNLDNFWVASSVLHQQKNLLGCALQAQLVCSALACLPEAIAISLPEVQVAEANFEAPAVTQSEVFAQDAELEIGSFR